MQLFLFRWRIFVPDLVCEALDHLLFQIHIEGKLTNEGKELERILLTGIFHVGKCFFCCFKFCFYVIL